MQTVSADVPDWVREAREKYTLRFRDWVAQAWYCTRHPYRFAAEWASHRRETLNPFRFFAVGTGLLYLADWLRIYVFPDSSWGGQRWLRSSLSQQLALIAVAGVMHPVLWAKSRSSFRATLAALAFSGAGPGAFMGIAGTLTAVGWQLAFHHVPRVDGLDLTAMPLPVAVGRYLPFVWMIASLAGAHRVRWWWAVLAWLSLFFASASAGVVAALVR